MQTRRKLKLSAILLVVLLPVGCFAAREYYSRPIQRHCYEFAIAFQAEGQDYVLRTPVVQEVYRGPAIAYGGVTIVTRPKIAAKRLPSGAGVFFNIPIHERYSLPKELTSKPGGPDRLPFAFWLDNARDPSRMEAYFSEEYYQQPSPHVVIDALASRDLPECEPADPGDEIPWLGGSREGRFLHGNFVHIVPEAEWSTFPKVAEALREVKEFKSIPEDVTAALRVTSPGVPTWGGHDDTIGTDSAGPVRVITNGFVEGIVRPAVREESYLRLLPDNPGEGVYYPETLSGLIKLRIGDRVQELRAGTWYYDPVGRNLMSVVSVIF